MQQGRTGLLEMSPAEFRRLSQFIYDRWGINLPPAKKILLEGRLRKRLQKLGIPTFKEYCEYLFSQEGISRESMEMIDLVTTNKTEFFREADHFQFLSRQVLPDWFEAAEGRTVTPFNLWSAGCSSGEEPYTLAMVLSEFMEENPLFRFHILATDISARVLATARDAVYPEEDIEPIPHAWRKKYLLRSKDPTRRQIRFTPAIRDQITFFRLNLMEIGAHVRETFQVIFCRNVIIYFDRPTQEKLLREFYHRLAPGGYLFLGHSESLTGLSLPLTPAAPTVYRKPA